MSENTKKLGLFALMAMVVSSSIGSGIFGISSDLAAGAAPGPAIIAWLIVGAGIAMLCLSLNNLIIKKPMLSGIFSYAEEGFGKFGGFISGWGYWLSAWLGNVAFATILMSALSYFFKGLGNGQNIPSIICASIIMWALTLLVNRGMESAAFINTIVTICKIVPLFGFIVIAVISFKVNLFTANFWGTASGNFSVGEIGKQVTSCMMVLMWVFVGIEGASMLSNRAEKKSEAGKATILGLFCLLAIYLLASLLPYGIMTQAELVNLKQPGMAYILERLVGPWGAMFINIGMIISVLGCWLSWTMLPCETTLLMAQRKLLPAKFGEVNSHNAPTYSLIFTSVLTQLFIFTLIFTDKAYNFAYSLCTAAIFISWLFVTLYQTKLSKQEGDGKQLLIGILGSAFQIWAIFAAGLIYTLLCFIVYIIGIFLYAQARKADGDAKVFSKNELIVAAVIVIGAISGIVMVATHIVSI